LTASSLILENYAQIIETKNEKTGRKKAVQVFPRYHQLDVVHKTLADVSANDAGRVAQRIVDDIAPKVAADQSYKNARQNTPNTARMEHDKALARVMLSLLKDDTEVYKQFVQNESFKRAVTDMVYSLTSG
jgi:hypothetical protein